MGKIALFVSIVIVLLQTVHKQITSLHCTLYSMKNDARFLCSCINSIIFLKNTFLRGIFEIDFISIDKLWVSDEEREMRMIFFFYEMFVVHVPIKFILITSADVGNAEF